MDRAEQSSGAQACCRLQHPLFARLAEVVFRLAEGDRAPVIAFTLGEKAAVIPLRAFQNELGIPDEAPDGQMLALIERALGFVNDLRLGEPLPGEVLGGEASWQPEPRHRHLAESRLRLQLAAWFSRRTNSQFSGADEDVVLAMADDPATRGQVQQAFASMAEILGLDSTEAVVGLLEEAAKELAYVEALRSLLLRRVEGLAGHFKALARTMDTGATRFEVMVRVRRLMEEALTRLRKRFEALDAGTSEVVDLLRNMEAQRGFIRGHRDWLFGSLRGWEPWLQEWEENRAAPEDVVAKLLVRTYRFLAPRYTPMQEWVNQGQAKAPPPVKRQLVW